MNELATNKEWKRWGETDPLYGVASWPGKKKEDSNPWTAEEFYKLGASDWSDFYRQWKKYGINNESCLEIGCGAGRITMQLGEVFKRVHAIDVSEKMIEYARQHINGRSVVFHVSNGALIPLEDHSVVSVFSCHVFQHFDSLSIAEALLGEVARVLRPGGTVMIHLPVYKWPAMPTIFELLYSVRRSARNISAYTQRLLMQYGIVKPIMRTLIYPVDFFYKVMPRLGFEEIEITIFATRSNNHPHTFVFAKKKQ